MTAITTVSPTLPHLATHSPLHIYVLNHFPITTYAAPIYTCLPPATVCFQVSTTSPAHAVFRFSAMTALSPPQASTGSLGTPAPAALAPALYTGYERFPKPAPRSILLATFENPKPDSHGPLSDSQSDLLHAQYRLSLLQWSAGTDRRQPTQLVTAMCGAFNAVLLQEAADHVPHVSDQFNTHTDGNNLAILLNKDTFLPNADKYPIAERSTSKNTWGLTALVVRGHLRRPPVGSQNGHDPAQLHLYTT